MKQHHYPAFAYKASELSAYSFIIDTFIISLKSGDIVHFVADDADDFKQWLYKQRIRDINQDNGIPVALKSG